MNLFDYIKSQLPSMPNVQIMKDMGASEELIEYIKETPWNTNLGMLAAYGCEPSGGTDTVTLTFVGSNLNLCGSMEAVSSPYSIKVDKDETITLPVTFEPQDGYNFWADEDGNEYAFECGETEYTPTRDMTFTQRNRD